MLGDDVTRVRQGGQRCTRPYPAFKYELIAAELVLLNGSDIVAQKGYWRDGDLGFTALGRSAGEKKPGWRALGLPLFEPPWRVLGVPPADAGAGGVPLLGCYTVRG